MTATLRESLKKHQIPRTQKVAGRKGQFGTPTREDIAEAVAEYLAHGGKIKHLEGAIVGRSIDSKGRWRGESRLIRVADYEPVSHFDIFALDTMVKE